MSDTIDDAREGIEKAHEAHHGHDGAAPFPHARNIAVLIAALAAALALAETGEKSAQNAYLTHHISLSDDYAFYQAKSARASILAAETGVLDSIQSLPGAPADAIAGKVKAARDAEARLRDDPGGQGMKQLQERAKGEAEARDHAFHLYHRYELVTGALQIAIVLASVSVVTRVKLLAVAGGGLGTAAGLLGLAVAFGLG